jgi:hypothetical protein
MIRRTALGIVAALILPAIADAAPNCSAVGAAQGCTCVTELVDGSPIAELTGISGDVKKTAAGAYTPTGAAAAMDAGDSLLIGTGAATLNAGPSCQAKILGAQTSVTAAAVEGCGCVWVTENKVPPPKDTVGDILTVTNAATAAALIINSENKDTGPISP